MDPYVHTCIALSLMAGCYWYGYNKGSEEGHSKMASFFIKALTVISYGVHIGEDRDGEPVIELHKIQK
jgi:hypothetical protein|tara:strand:- start:6793 stop:6996 length:204 start_codon:yes stop_codon:yes gene_type:complete